MNIYTGDAYKNTAMPESVEVEWQNRNKSSILQTTVLNVSMFKPFHIWSFYK